MSELSGKGAGKLTRSDSGSFLSSLLNSKSTPREIRFFIIVGGIFLFFGLHNFMQELIMSLPGFKVNTFIML